MLDHPHIITDLHVLDAWTAARRTAGERIVFTNGCFDILHPGHVDLLARARALGDVLLLALNSDNSVRRLNKGPDRPLNPFPARAFVAAHLASVDMVTMFDEDTPLDIIRHVRPDVLVKGGDWPLEAIVGAELVQKSGGAVFSLPFVDGYSTTSLVDRIRATEP